MSVVLGRSTRPIHDQAPVVKSWNISFTSSVISDIPTLLFPTDAHACGVCPLRLPSTPAHRGGAYFRLYQSFRSSFTLITRCDHAPPCGVARGLRRHADHAAREFYPGHRALSALRHANVSYPQPVCANACRSALGKLPGAAVPAGAEVFLSQRRLFSSHLHRTPADCCGTLGAPDHAAGEAPDRHGCRARRRGGEQTGAPTGHACQSGYAVAACPIQSLPRSTRLTSLGGGCLGLPQRASLRDHSGGLGAPESAGRLPRP